MLANPMGFIPLRLFVVPALEQKDVGGGIEGLLRRNRVTLGITLIE